MSDDITQENKTEELSSDVTIKNVEKPYTDDKGKFKEGNPGGGRPKGSGLNLTSLLKAELENKPEGSIETYKELFIKRLLKNALVDGDFKSLKLILNYVDGLPTQRVEGVISNINIDYDNLSDEQLKERVSSYLERIGEEGEEEGDS